MKKIWPLIGLILGLLFPSSVAAEVNQYVTVVNPVRVAYYTKDLQANLQRQYGVVVKNELPATWLLTYDVLLQKPTITLLKNFNTGQELGAFLEVSPALAKEAGVTYANSGSWHFANSLFLTGYSQEERLRLIDTLFSTFKVQFGYYPKSVGAWWTDSYSLAYMHDKYGVVANLVVADQFSTDGYQVWGQYWGAPYYPSRWHAAVPADESTKLNVVNIQWAPRDPVSGYYNSYYSTQDYVRLAKKIDYFEHFLNLYGSAADNKLGQITVGLEADMAPESYAGEYANQLQAVAKKVATGRVRAVRMQDFAAIFSGQFGGTPPFFYTSDGFANPETSAEWYQSSRYRIGLFKDKKTGKRRVVDLRLYFPDLIEPYYFSPNRDTELAIYVPSVIDSFQNPTEAWDVTGLDFKFREEGFDIKGTQIQLPAAIVKNPGLTVRPVAQGYSVEVDDHWAVGPGGYVFSDWSLEAKHLLRSKKFLLGLLIGQNWGKLTREKYFVSQGEVDALHRLALLPRGKVLIVDSECLQCVWHTPHRPAVFANARGYISKLGKHPTVVNSKVFTEPTREAAKREFAKLGVHYIYVVKYENYVEQVPFSPGDLGVEKIYANANAELWKIKS